MQTAHAEYHTLLSSPKKHIDHRDLIKAIVDSPKAKQPVHEESHGVPRGSYFQETTRPDSSEIGIRKENAVKLTNMRKVWIVTARLLK
jgi:hypothetical protein